MGRVFLKYLDGSVVYTCSNCKCHLSLGDDIISTNFHGRQGKAYLFNRVVNVISGPPEERSLITGMHVVRDVFCTYCHIILGWKYDDAHEDSQRYKIGKYVLEKARLRKDVDWLLSEGDGSGSESDDGDEATQSPRAYGQRVSYVDSESSDDGDDVHMYEDFSSSDDDDDEEEEEEEEVEEEEEEDEFDDN